MKELTEFLGSHKLPGELIFAKVWGSRSHDTHLPTSDWDFSGIYIAPTESILGIDRCPETVDGKNPDYSFHEIGKFASLLLKGNPGIVESLFTMKMTAETEDWEELKSQKHKFLCKNVVSSYIGYAQGQMSSLEKGTYLRTTGGAYNEKWAYHMIRLLSEAERISNGGEPVVWKSGEEKELLMSIRNHQMSEKEVVELAKCKLDFIKSKAWNIPEEPDFDLVNKWVIKCRMKRLRGRSATGI